LKDLALTSHRNKVNMFRGYLIQLLSFAALQGSIIGLNNLADAITQNVPARGLESRQNLPASTWPYQTFVTEPDFHPPVLEISKTVGATDGLFFLVQSFFGSVPGPGTLAPLIMTEGSDVVWHGPNTVSGAISANLAVQKLHGKDVLTYWTGPFVVNGVAGHGFGIIKILDTTYREIYTVSLNDSSFIAGDGMNNSAYPSYIDNHESLITPQGSILVTAYNSTPYDLSSVGGPKNGWLSDSQFYEIDIKTNRTLFKWSSLDHVDRMPINQSHFLIDGAPFEGQNATHPWEYFTLNSVTTLDDGYLISSRFFSSIYALAKDGSVKWNLQGIIDGDFQLGPGAQFQWQHHVRPAYSSGDYLFLHMFNDDNLGLISTNQTSPSTGLTLFLDLSKRTATVVSSLLDPKDIIYANSQGSYQPLGNGHNFLGYGQSPTMKEFDQHGDVVMDVKFGNQVQVSSYRAFLQQWSGKPTTVPLANATAKGFNSTTVCMSWNGATPNVYDSWLVYAGGAKDSLTLAADVSRTGFETNATIGTAKFVQVAAVKGAQVLSKSRAIPVSIS